MHDAIITADPTYIDLAWKEVQGSTSQPKQQAVLADGVLLVRFKETFTAVGERWRQQPPIFVRHMCPVETMIDLSGDEVEDLAALKRVARQELAAAIPTSTTFSVQTRILTKMDYKPFAVNDIVSQTIQQNTGSHLNVRQPKMVVSVVISRIRELVVACLGVSDVTHNLSDWAGGERRFRKEPDQISRAEFKLLEAMEVFGLTLPDRGLALDLGAAPGGWTRILRQHSDELLVHAVDPGELHPQLQADWGVYHARISAEAHLQQSRQTTYDIILNDMRLDARRSARLMCSYAPRLAPAGFAVMTVKLPQRDPMPLLNQTFDILGQQYALAGARQLFHNRHEVTVYLRRRA